MRSRTIINPPPSYNLLAEALDEAKMFELRFASDRLRYHQARGEFPKQAALYQVMYHERGSARRRQLSKINPGYMKFPNKIIFLNQSAGNRLNEAMEMLQRLFAQYAPVRKGIYRQSLKWFMNARMVGRDPQKIIAINKTKPLGAKDTINVVSGLPYSSTLESNYFVRKKTNGIMYRIALEMKTFFGNDLAIRFSYVSAKPLGLYYQGKAFAYAVPVITLGIPGAFNTVLRNPGERARKRKTGRKSSRRTKRI